VLEISDEKYEIARWLTKPKPVEGDYEDGRYGFTSIEQDSTIYCFISLTEEESKMSAKAQDEAVRKRVFKGPAGA
jgi:hypothetical protein